MRIDSTKCMISLILLLIPVMMIASSDIHDFSADMIQTTGEEQTEGKIYVKGERYRMDMVEEGEEISIIVNRETGITKLLIHSQKAFQEMSNTGMRSLSNNPFESARFSAEEYESREIGSETINGYECQKTEVYGGEKGKEQKLMSIWVAEKVNWPIKIILESVPPMVLELKNIKKESLDESIFQIPDGYENMSSSKSEKGMETSPETEESQVESKDLTEAREAVFKVMKEKGIERVTEEGTIKLKVSKVPVLEEFFPGWNFFDVTREKDVNGGTSFGFIPVNKAAVSSNNEKVFLLQSPGTTMPLEDGLSMVKSKDIHLKGEEDVKKFANALVALYFKSSEVESVELLEKGKWAIYTGTFFDYFKGFVLELEDNGKILVLSYDLKIKEK